MKEAKNGSRANTSWNRMINAMDMSFSYRFCYQFAYNTLYMYQMIIYIFFVVNCKVVEILCMGGRSNKMCIVYVTSELSMI